MNYKPDARFTHACYLLKLEKGGVHFNIDDITETEWNWLAEIKAAIEQKQIEEIRNKR